MKKNNSVQDKKMIAKQLQEKHQKLFDDFEAFSKELTAKLRNELAANASLFAETNADKDGRDAITDDFGLVDSGIASEVANDTLQLTGTDD